MSDTRWHLAQVNIGRARGAVTDPVMRDFMAHLVEINATAVRPYPHDDRVMINMSVWTDLEALKGYVFRTAHAAVMRRRREWFEKFDGAFDLEGNPVARERVEWDDACPAG